MRKPPGKQTLIPFSLGVHNASPSSPPLQLTHIGWGVLLHTQQLNSVPSPSLKIAWMALIALHWACSSVKFCHLIDTSLCHGNEQQSNWKRFLESRDLVSAAGFPLSIPRVRGWKCYLMEQQGLLNTWQARSSQGKSVPITFYFKTPKPFAVQCCTLWLCHRIAATISRSVGLQHCPGAAFSQGSVQWTCQTHHSK